MQKKSFFIINFVIVISSLFFICLTTINNKTITPSWFANDYLPWKNKVINQKYSLHGYKHHGHDQIMQFFFNRADDHQTGFDKNSYSIDFQLGLAKKTRIEFSNLTEKYFYKYLLILNKNSSNFENIQIANNISSFFIFIIAFFLVQIILNKIFSKKIENIFFSLILNPIFFLPSEEGWYMPVLGIYFFILSFLIYYNDKDNNKIKFKENLIVFLLCFISGHLIINSMSFHFWLYSIILGFVFSFFIFKKIGKKIFFFTFGFLASIILNESLILEAFNTLSISSSKIEVNKFYHNLMSLEYAVIPMGYFIPNIIFPYIYKILNLNFFPANYFINIGEGFFGYSVLILSTYGFFNIKDKQLKIAIILCTLYWIGPLQMFLRIFIGGPFLSETSTGGRFGTIIYIVLNTMAMFAYYKIKNGEIVLNKNFKKITLIVLIFVIIQIFFFIIKNKIFFFGIIFLFPLSCFYLFLKKKNYIYLFLSIIFLPYYHTVSKYGKNSIYPNETTKLDREIFLNNKFNENDVGVIANNFNGKWYIKEPIHPNTLILFNVRSLNGFVTPANKFYLKLYNYQWMTNWPNKKIEEIINPKNNHSKKVENTEYLLKYTHRHYTFPIPVSNNEFSKQTEKFFDLSGVNLIFTDSSVNLKGHYKLIKFKNEIKIWKRLKYTYPISLVCRYTLHNYNISSFKKLLSNNFKFKDEAMLYNPTLINKCDNHTKIINYKIDKKNKNFFIIKLENPSGIIKTNFVWNNLLSAKNQNNKKIKTVMCNGSFTCIIPDANSNQISLSYERPKIIDLINNVLKNSFH